MSLTTIILILLVLALVGAFPVWPHSQSWNYVPSSIIGVLVIIVIVLLVTNRL